jgi:hypothetical protein
MKLYTITCYGRNLNHMILTKKHSCSPEGDSIIDFTFSSLELVRDQNLELAFFSEKEIELIMSKDGQDHQEIRGHLQNHWQRHILDHNNYFDITPVPIEVKI